MSKISGKKSAKMLKDELTQMWSFYEFFAWCIYIPGHEKAYDICVFNKETLMNLMSTLVSLPLLKT